jgi:hypothetical protein
MWRIVNDLNALKEPILFKNDGSSVDLVKEAAVAMNGAELKFDDSAMGRGLRCLLFALVYIDRICQRNVNFCVHSRNVHRLLLGTMYAAHKFSDDAPFKMSHFAVLGGVSTEEMRKIEVAVCFALEFNFYISEAEFRTHALSQLNFAVKGAYQRKVAQKSAQSSSAAHVDVRALSAEEAEYGLGGSTPLMPTSSRKSVGSQIQS